MLLAFWLIRGVIKSNRAGKDVPASTVTLVTLYLGVSIVLVVVGAVMQSIGPNSVELRIASVDDPQSLKEMKLDGKFRILLNHNGLAKDIVKEPYSVRLAGGREHMGFSANSLILLIQDQNYKISELIKDRERTRKPADDTEGDR